MSLNRLNRGGERTRYAVANWNGMLLYADPDGTPRACGTLLPLARQSKEAGFAPLGDSSVEVASGGSQMLVRFDSNLEPAEIGTAATHVAAAGLDMLAAAGGPVNALGIDRDASLSWWIEHGTRVSRLVLHHGLQFGVRIAALRVLDPDGNEVYQPPLPEPVLHESLRYFRLSQCTDDLFDAFRNAYLAIESALADVRSKRPNENEAQWLKAAVLEAQQLVDLHLDLGCGRDEVSSYFHDEVYKAVRCNLFHGKAMGLDPGSAADREKVFDAYSKVVQSYLSLASTRYNARRRGRGGLTPAGFAGLHGFMNGWVIRAGDGRNQLDCGELATLESTALPPQPGRIQHKGIAHRPFAHAMDPVTFVAAFDKEELAFSHALEGEFYLDSLDTFEVVIDLWNSVDPGYRTAFAG